MFRVFYDICRGGFHADAFLQFDDACFFEQLETTAFIGRVVRDGDGSAVRQILDILVLIGVDAHAHQDSFADRDEVCIVLFVEVLQERFMLVDNEVEIVVSECLIRSDIVGEFLHVDLETVAFCFFGSGFDDFCMRAGCSTDGDLFLFLYRGSGRGGWLCVGTTAGDDGCCGEGAKSSDDEFL